MLVANTNTVEMEQHRRSLVCSDRCGGHAKGGAVALWRLGDSVNVMVPLF